MNRLKFRRLFVSGTLTNSIRSIGRILKLFMPILFNQSSSNCKIAFVYLSLFSMFYVVYMYLFLNELSKCFLCAIFRILKLYTSSLNENCVQAFNIPLLNYYNIFTKNTGQSQCSTLI